MGKPEWVEAPEPSAGVVVVFPRFPRRRVGVIPHGQGFKAAVLLADGRPSSLFPQSREFASTWLAGEAARHYARVTGMPLAAGVVRPASSSHDDGPIAA